MTQKYFGYWIFGRDMENVDLEKLKKTGVTDVFLNFYAFETHGQSKVVSWIKKANNNGIGVHIWMQCFYDGEWINPVTNSSIISEKVNEAKKYASINGVKGVHLDYLRYPGNAYKTSGSADAITDFVRKVRSSVGENIFLSCATMPESENRYYYGQDIQALGKIVDAVLPMQYKGNYQAGTSWLKSTTKDLSSKAKIWSGLQTYKSDDDTTQLSEKELLEDAQVCLDNGAKGVILFRYGITPLVDFTRFNSSVTETVQIQTSASKEAVKKETIYKIAQDVKKTYESDKKIPSKSNGIKAADFAYLLAKAVYKPNKDIIPKSVKMAQNPSGTKFSQNIMKEDYTDMAKRVVSYINKYGYLPNYVTYGSYKVEVDKYIDAFARIVNFYYSQGKIMPKYVKMR